MLKAKSLDDKTYQEILEAAMNRLPSLCPDWTDYNAHDPGVTLLELFAWYEEMQRFHLDQMTEQIRRKFLALLGVTPRSVQPAKCRVEMSGASGVWPEGTLLCTEESIPFELAETIRIGTVKLDSVHLEGEGNSIDVTDLLRRDGVAIQPFLYGGTSTDMVVTFSQVDTTQLRLWFEVNEPQVCRRNPFADKDQMPRVIRWFWNDTEIHTLSDDTHALSVSGFITLPVTEGEHGRLRLTLEDPGCEETVRISAIQCHICCAQQQQTWSRCFTDTVSASEMTEKDLCFAPAVDGTLTVFIRTEKGWEQVQSGAVTETQTGKHLALDTRSAVQDGKENLMIICTSIGCMDNTFFASNGLPNQELPLSLQEGKPVGELTLLCDSLDTDGAIRPMLWHRVDDLNVCGPRDRVFTYDERRGSLMFGDGRHGAIVPAGEGSVLVASLQVSFCDKGNVPEGTSLYYPGTKQPFTCSQGVGGAEAESAEEACIRFMKKFPDTHKCVTAEDYARLAMETPGLRVAMAKALPGFDPQEPAGNTARPVVNVVVVPYSSDIRPMPDERFLAAVERQLEKYRPICTQVVVSPPRYLPLGVQLRVRADKAVTEDQIQAMLYKWFSERKIGQTVVKNELALYLQKQPGIWKIERLELLSAGGCVRNGLGDMTLPQNGIAYLEQMQIEIL